MIDINLQYQPDKAIETLGIGSNNSIRSEFNLKKSSSKKKWIKWQPPYTINAFICFRGWRKNSTVIHFLVKNASRFKNQFIRLDTIILPELQKLVYK